MLQLHFLLQIFLKSGTAKIVDISMFITICYVVTLIFSKLRHRSKKIGYKYIYVRTNKKISVTRNKIAQSLERQGFRRVTPSVTRCNNVSNTNRIFLIVGCWHRQIGHPYKRDNQVPCSDFAPLKSNG